MIRCTRAGRRPPGGFAGTGAGIGGAEVVVLVVDAWRLGDVLHASSENPTRIVRPMTTNLWDRCMAALSHRPHELGQVLIDLNCLVLHTGGRGRRLREATVDQVISGWRAG